MVSVFLCALQDKIMDGQMVVRIWAPMVEDRQSRESSPGDISHSPIDSFCPTIVQTPIYGWGHDSSFVTGSRPRL